MSSDFLITGGIHVLLAVILFAGTDMNALSVLGFTGAAALVAGVFSIVGGTARRSGRSQTRAGEEEADAEAARTPADEGTDRTTPDRTTPDRTNHDAAGGDEP
jgi:hypothetical protein